MRFSLRAVFSLCIFLRLLRSLSSDRSYVPSTPLVASSRAFPKVCASTQFRSEPALSQYELPTALLLNTILSFSQHYTNAGFYVGWHFPLLVRHDRHLQPHFASLIRLVHRCKPQHGLKNTRYAEF